MVFIVGLGNDNNEEQMLTNSFCIWFISVVVMMSEIPFLLRSRMF